jgi:O-antigen/teichoic acid export membrane protein
MSAGLEAGAAALTTRRLGQRALSLGAANAFDYAAQFLLPVVLARCLDPGAFGEYRVLWLAVGTVMVVATLAMPGSLYYFLPRSDGATKRLYINQTLVFLAFAGLISGWAVSSWNPWLLDKMRGLAEYHRVPEGRAPVRLRKRCRGLVQHRGGNVLASSTRGDGAW